MGAWYDTKDIKTHIQTMEQTDDFVMHTRSSVEMIDMVIKATTQILIICSCIIVWPPLKMNQNPLTRFSGVDEI